MKTNSIKLLSTGALFAVSALTAHSQIVITEAMGNSSHAGGPGNGDWIEIYNSGPSAIDLTGWSWDDDSATPGVGNFGNVTLQSGAFLIVVDENAANTTLWIDNVWNVRSLVNAGTLTVIDNSGWAAGLSAGGEDFYIFDADDNLVASANSGNQSAPNAGRSFAWSIFGDDLGRSSNGDFGAFIALDDGNGAAGTDIASPGFAAIPEPSSAAALAGLAMLGLAATRRRSRSA
jgi:hypothetical protein